MIGAIRKVYLNAIEEAQTEEFVLFVEWWMRNQMKQCREVGQGRLPGGGRSDTGADLEGCLGTPQKESRKGHSGQEGEDRHRPVSERRQVGDG